MKNVFMILMMFVATTALSQSSRGALKLGGRVSADKPTVFMEYVCRDKKKVYLRMHNNTVWHISGNNRRGLLPVEDANKAAEGGKHIRRASR